MVDPKIFGRLRHIADSALLHALSDDLSDIRKEDGLTWLDVGKVLGRGEDVAPRYADGSVAMSFTSFLRGQIVWGSRFTGSVDRIIARTRPAEADGHKSVQCLLTAATEIHNLLSDGKLSDEDIREARAELAAARDDIDALLARLGPKDQDAIA